MGSRSRSSSSNASTSTNNQRQISLDAKENEGIAVSAGGDVTITDAGATAQALDFASEAGADVLQFADSVFSQSLGALENDNAEQYAQQVDTLKSVASAARSETSQALDKISTYFFLTVAVVGGLYVIGSSKK